MNVKQNFSPKYKPLLSDASVVDFKFGIDKIKKKLMFSSV